jgi:hypothetical protein
MASQPGDASGQPSESGPTAGGPGADELRDALKAFKKRLKLARLDDESRLGKRALTKGGKSDIVAIQPPRQYPRAVWDELVKQGRLKYAGQGLYELVSPPQDR